MQRDHLATSFAALLCAAAVWAGCVGEGTLSVEGGAPDSEILPDSPSAGTRDAEPGSLPDPARDPGQGQPGQIQITIEEPAEGLITDTPEVRVQGTAVGLAEVLINGATAAVSDGRFRTKAPLEEGDNQIDVAAPGGEVHATVHVLRDSLAPSLVLTQPARGTFVELGAGETTVVVSGRAVDAALGVERVTVAGEAVVVGPDGSFEGSTVVGPGLHTVVVEAWDFVGHSARATRSLIAGEFVAPSTPVEQALVGSVGPAVLDALEPFLVDQIMAQGLEEGLAGQDSGEFEVRDVRYGRVDLDLSLAAGGLGAQIVIHDLRVEFRTEQEILFVDVTFTGEARADRAELRTLVVVTPTAEGSLAVRLDRPSVSLHGFEVDVDNFPGFLEDLLRGTVEDMAEELVQDALNDVVIPELFDPAMLSQQIDLLGRPLSVQLAFSAFDVQPDAARFELRATAQAEPDPRAPQTPEALSDPAPAPGAPPSPDRLVAAAADDFVQRVLHAVFVSGVLHADLDELMDTGGGDEPAALPIELTVGTLDGFLGGPFDGLLAPETPVGLRLEALLPPVARPSPSPDAPIELLVGDLLLHFEARPEGLATIPLVSVALAAEMRLSLAVPEPGQLVPTVEMDVLPDLDAEPFADVEDERVEQFIGQLVALALPLLSGAPLELGLELLDGVRLGELSVAGDPGSGYFTITAQVVPAG